MAFTEYVGARYVPIFGRVGDDTIEWDNSKEYEPLTIVLHQGNSFTSRQYVPVGIDINDGEYWAETGNFNAQIEQYRAEVLSFDNRIKSKLFIFDTISEMKESNLLFDGAYCHTNGFSQVGDNGGGFYLIESNKTANEIDCITCNDNLFAVLQNKIISFEMLGIKQNTTDDTHIIKYAFDKYRDFNLTKDAIYLLNDSITLYSNTTIHGNNATFEFTDNLEYDQYSLIYANESENICVYDTNFIFSEQVQYHPSISLLTINKFIFDNCYFSGGFGYNFRINYSHNFMIKNCIFENQNGDANNVAGGIYGLSFYDGIIDNCTFINCPDHGIYCSGDDENGIRNVKILNCTFINNGFNTSTNGCALVFYSNSFNCIAENNTFENCTGAITARLHGNQTYLPSNIIIKSNIIKNSSTQAISLIGIAQNNVIDNINIEKNIIEKCNTGITIRYCNLINVINNIINDCNRSVEVGLYSNYININNNIFNNSDITPNSSTCGIIIGYSGDSYSNYINACNNIIIGKFQYGIYARRSWYSNFFANNIILDETVGLTGQCGYEGIVEGVKIIGEGRNSITFAANPSELKENYRKGDICFNSNPSTGAIGWICTSPGKPGTWSAFATI